jgi:hypothetical protein
MSKDGGNNRIKSEVFDDKCLFEAQRRWEEDIGLRHCPEGAKLTAPVAPPQSYSRMYPFTKGMILTNEAVGYGEVVLQEMGWFRGKSFRPVRTLRTRTGVMSLDADPNAPSEPPSLPDPPPEARRVRTKRRSK